MEGKKRQKARGSAAQTTLAWPWPVGPSPSRLRPELKWTWGRARVGSNHPGPCWIAQPLFFSRFFLLSFVFFALFYWKTQYLLCLFCFFASLGLPPQTQAHTLLPGERMPKMRLQLTHPTYDIMHALPVLYLLCVHTQHFQILFGSMFRAAP